MAKQHPKDERECDNTHSHNQDEKDAYYRIEHFVFSESQEPNLIRSSCP